VERAQTVTGGRTLAGDPARFAGGLGEVGREVWAWVQPNGGWGEANAGLIAGARSCLLVDTLWDEHLAREMIAGMAAALGHRPLRFVFNTHSDGDHWWGNRVIPDATEIITTAASRATMEHDVSPRELARLARVARIAARVPGPLQPLSRYMNRMFSPFDFDGVRARFPDRTFSGEAQLQLGDREVRLIEVGPAHTPGDAIAHVPDAGVVFAADVLFAGSTPVMWFGPLEGWIAALDTLLGLEAEVYVPGHGPPGGRAIVEEMRDYMSWLGDTVRAEHARGHSPLEAARAAVAAPEFGRWRDWVAPERILITISTIHSALVGKPPVGVSSAARARLFAQVAAFGAELAR
jgi:glyoxylase-like metal-dependent hydrolase (beta-lactamase superfamily II)